MAGSWFSCPGPRVSPWNWPNGNPVAGNGEPVRARSFMAPLNAVKWKRLQDRNASFEDLRMTSLSPARIMEVGMGFWPAKVLLSAIELGLFTKLGAQAMTGDMLADSLQLHPRANPDFFDTLVALHFL